MENKETKKRTFMEFLGEYGTYALVILCILVVTVVSIVAVPSKKKHSASKSDAQNITAQATETPESAKPVTGNGDESLKDMLDPITGNIAGTTHSPTQRPTAAPDFTPAPTQAPAQKELLSPPVDGEITWGFAINELIYSATLDQWTTHAGVDVACKQGDKIHAVADGVAEKVYEDDAYGITVVIKHKDGTKSVYSNLAKSEGLIKEGQSVKSNAVIGVCGNTAKFECADKSHLHFEFYVNGKPVDPAKYVRFKTLHNQ